MASRVIDAADVKERLLTAPAEFDPVMIDREAALAGNISDEQRDGFKRNGFVVIEKLLADDLIERLKGRFEPLFRGEFDTGVFPDEWYWREGMSLPDVTRHMGNAWKSDLTIGSLVLSPVLTRIAAKLAGWDGIRIGTDTLWWKPPGTSEIALHQDDTYYSFFRPPESITIWLTLDDTTAEAGTIEYVARVEQVAAQARYRRLPYARRLSLCDEGRGRRRRGNPSRKSFGLKFRQAVA